MDFRAILRACDDQIWGQRVKLLRHASADYDLSLVERSGFLREYEERQGKPILDRTDVVLSFLGERGSQARFVGASRVGPATPKPGPWPKAFPYPGMHPGNWRYQLERLPQFDSMCDRLVIDWGGGRGFHQHLRAKDMVEIRPVGFVGHFPGYEAVLLDFAELQRLVANPTANRVWHRMLSEVAGVYLIVDTHSGTQYVGSAYGNRGILGRWASYCRTPHGNNRLLKELLEANPGRHRSFQFAILRTLPKTKTAREVIEVESHLKRTLGTRAFGLNAN